MIDLGNICLRLGLGPTDDQAAGDFKHQTQNDSSSATRY